MSIVIIHDEQPSVPWREGNLTRLHASESTGAELLSTGEQWFEPGTGAPTHSHPEGVEEVILVLSGRGEFWMNGRQAELSPGDTLTLPPTTHHGFRAIGTETLHIWGAFSSPAPPTVYDDDAGTMIAFGARAGEVVDANRRRRVPSFTPREPSEGPGAMLIARIDDQPVAQIRPGNLLTRLMAAASLGSRFLTVGEQIFECGSGSPTHHHPGRIEEVITVLRGRGDFWVGREHLEVGPEQTIVLPRNTHHGFRSVDEEPLHIRAAFSGSTVPTVYDEGTGDVFEFGGQSGTPVDATRMKRTTVPEA